MLWIFATAFSAPEVVVPVFIREFTKSNIIVGLTVSLGTAGWFLPQLFIANYLERLPRRKVVYDRVMWLRLLSWGLLVFFVALFAKSAAIVIASFLILYTIHTMGAGVAGLSFMDVVGKVIPIERLGTFFGARMFGGGLLAVGAGLIVRHILKHEDIFPFPNNYVLLFSLTFIFLCISLPLFTLIKEPPGPALNERRSFIEFLKKGRELLKEDQDYKKLLSLRLIAGIGAIALPFYIIYGQQVLKFPKGMLGFYLGAQNLGMVVSNLFWGYLSDRKGTKLVLQTGMGLSLLIPTGTLAIGVLTVRGFLPLTISAYLYMLVFILMGFASSGAGMGHTNYLMEISPEVFRPTYLGFMNTFVAPLAFLPTLGGLVADLTSYYVLFGIALVSTLVSLIMTRGLREPREVGNGARS